MTLAFAILLFAATNPFPAPGDDAVDFTGQIRPILERHCVKCHGATTQKNGLRLDVRDAAFNGGDNGPVIVAGKSGRSELLRRVTSSDPEERMPPEKPQLEAGDVDLLSRWIDSGADWPESEQDRASGHDARLNHWAWQPLSHPVPPELTHEAAGLVCNDIDRFVLKKLSEQELLFSSEADRRTLIRRLSFDLLGLPPAPEDIDAFISDTDPRAVEHLVDRMLASPHYGERWAGHWLDIAHYADTHGFERDQRRDNAWRYRDWVIRALNSDLPYDQFLRDQVAGDVLRPDDPDAVAATGFLAAGPWDFVGQAETPSPVLKRQARADDLDDMVTQVMTASCGVTINCARCHDHKLDPISQQEYYSLWSVFAGVKRSDRILSTEEEQQRTAKKAELEEGFNDARSELARLQGSGWSLADLVGGGDGHGTGKASAAIDPVSGAATEERRGFLEGAVTNQFAVSDVRFIDGVVIPDGGESGEVPVTSTGIRVTGVPDTSGKAWDAIRNGPVNSQFSTELGGTDFTKEGHTLLSLHANSAITFDLQALRAAGLPESVRLSAQAGYFGQTPHEGASFHVFLDGQLLTERRGLGRDDGVVGIEIELPSTGLFLTLMATDNGNDIGHDQICFADAVLLPVTPIEHPDNTTQVTALRKRIEALGKTIAELPTPAKVYAVSTEQPSTVNLLKRGDPEQPGSAVTPGTISCVPHAASFGGNELTDAQRRIALADWIVSPKNPLTSRVIANRLWHHHFGVGLVDTPSDFGLGGGLPSHPELLDWLASRLQQESWSLKAMHRLICLSAAYRQSSARMPQEHGLTKGRLQRAEAVDAGNRLLWRQNPRRLDSESVRDSVLQVSGQLQTKMFGPGYRDFEYREEYAPVYTYITADTPELWRRSIYRFVVRTTPNPFLTTLDCPNAANLTPARNITTTALQSLALLNNEFMLKQAGYLASRLSVDPEATTEQQVSQTFQLAFGREPSPEESTAAVSFIEAAGAEEFCRAMMNANEFVYID